MAAKKRNAKKNGPVLTREFYLGKHDEEKVLLFAAGILFGIGISSYLLQGETVFVGLTLIIIGLILAFIEARQ